MHSAIVSTLGGLEPSSPIVQDIGHAMSAFMLEYWDKEHWNVTLSEDPRVMAGLEHGAREGVGKGVPKRVSMQLTNVASLLCLL